MVRTMICGGNYFSFFTFHCHMLSGSPFDVLYVVILLLCAVIKHVLLQLPFEFHNTNVTREIILFLFDRCLWFRKKVAYSEALLYGRCLPELLMKYIKIIIDQIVIFKIIFSYVLNFELNLQGEDICDGAIREVKEETGVSRQTQYIF